MPKYRIKGNEPLSQIAARFKTTIQDLLRANPGVTKFTPGMGIKIPHTALGALTPEQQSQLTPQASNLLAKVPYSTVPNLTLRGMQVGGGYQQLIPGTTGRIVINSAVADKPWLNLHESLHAIDTSTGASSAMQFSQDTRRQLVNRYYSSFENGYRGGNFGNESHIPQREAFAAGGQLGPAGIPPEMAKYYSNVFNKGQVLPPPTPDFGANWSDAGASVQLPNAPKTSPGLSFYAQKMAARVQTQTKTQPAPFMTMEDRMAGYLGEGGSGTSLSPNTQASGDPFQNLSPGAQQYYINRYLKHRAKNAAARQAAGQPTGFGLVDFGSSKAGTWNV